MNSSSDPDRADTRPHVVIVGGGFGGLYAAHALRRAPVRVTVLDRTNHSVFFPLLYQVATAGLSADEVAAPIRSLLRRQRNAEVRMTEVTGVATARKEVLTTGGPLAYDYLVLATGSRYSYFGHPEWQQHAPSLRSIADAAAIRRRLLQAFERAELARDPEEIRSLLTFVLVGGGPTGVEMAGAIAELARTGLTDEYRRINPGAARIVLVEAGPRLLAGFPEHLARKARLALERMEVEVRSGVRVTDITAEGVTIAGGEVIASRNVIWTAGVVASSAGSWLGAETDRSGRVKVAPDLSAPGHADVFVVGDTAFLEQDGKALPGVAQVAIQQGLYAAEVIRRRVEARTAPAPFHYRDPGNMATVGRSFAVADFGRFTLSGLAAWLLWLLIHIYYLSGLRNRMQVLMQWTWAYFTYERNVRVLSPDATGVEPPAAPLREPDRSVGAIGD